MLDNGFGGRDERGRNTHHLTTREVLILLKYRRGWMMQTERQNIERGREYL
jgi:hypothetical protein